MILKNIIAFIGLIGCINTYALTVESHTSHPCGGESSPGCKIVWEKLTVTEGVEGSMSQEILSTSAQKKSLKRSGADLVIPLVVAKVNEVFNVYGRHPMFIRNETGYPHLYAIEAKLQVMDKIWHYEGNVDLQSGERFLNCFYSSLYGLKIDKRGTYGIFGETIIGSPDFDEVHRTQRLVIE